MDRDDREIIALLQELRLLAHSNLSVTRFLNLKVDQLMSSTTQLDTDIAALQAAVAADQTVEQSAITLLNGIPAMIAAAVQAAMAAGATPAELAAVEAVATQLQTNAAALAAAVAANTPAAPAPAPAPAAPSTP